MPKINIKKILFYMRLHWGSFCTQLSVGFWLTASDLLWKIPAYREGYYAYRTDAWNSAKSPLTFPEWLERGGWKL